MVHLVCNSVCMQLILNLQKEIMILLKLSEVLPLTQLGQDFTQETDP